MTNSPEDKWYKEGLRFECLHCGKCCGGAPGFVWITEKDISNLAAKFAVSADDFIKLYARRIGQRLSLKEKPDGDCVLLENGRCIVYEARPTQCIAFPFWHYNLKTQEDWERLAGVCPGINKGNLENLQEIEDALKNNF